MDRNKLINAIITGDHRTIETILPPPVVDFYQIEGCDEVFHMDGAIVPSKELTCLERSNAFITIKTYLSPDELISQSKNERYARARETDEK